MTKENTSSEIPKFIVTFQYLVREIQISNSFVLRQKRNAERNILEAYWKYNWKMKRILFWEPKKVIILPT